MHHGGVQGQEDYGKSAGVSRAIYSFTACQLDCGIHPGLSGMDALPYVDLIEADEIDLLLISQ